MHCSLHKYKIPLNYLKTKKQLLLVHYIFILPLHYHFTLHILPYISYTQYSSVPTHSCMHRYHRCKYCTHASSVCMPTWWHTSAPLSSAVWTWCHGHCIHHTLCIGAVNSGHRILRMHVRMQVQVQGTQGRACTTQCVTCWHTLTEQKMSLSNLQWRTEPSSHLLRISIYSCMCVRVASPGLTSLSFCASYLIFFFSILLSLPVSRGKSSSSTLTHATMSESTHTSVHYKHTCILHACLRAVSSCDGAG